MPSKTLPFVVALFSFAPALAEVPDPDPERFSDDIAAFEAWDAKNATPEDAILFVGSSSIRLWSTAEAFPDKPVVNRGFGGSELSDVMHFFDVLVTRHTPTTIVLYEGDNDIEHGKPAGQVFDDFEAFVERVQRELPDARIVFISIKPSPSRWDMWPAMVEANRLVAAFADQHEDIDYADLATPLLEQSGEPGDFFVADDLHLNDRGYEAWRKALMPYLDARPDR